MVWVTDTADPFSFGSLKHSGKLLRSTNGLVDRGSHVDLLTTVVDVYGTNHLTLQLLFDPTADRVMAMENVESSLAIIVAAHGTSLLMNRGFDRRCSSA